MGSAVRAPGPRRQGFTSPFRAFRADPPGFLVRCAREYGDIVHFKLGPRHYFLLSHPDYIKAVLVTNNGNFTKSRGLQRAKVLLGEGLVTSEGEFHQRQRRLAQPAFHRQRLAAYASTMSRQTVELVNRWQNGQTRDIAHDMTRLTLAIVNKTLYNTDIEAKADEIGAAFTACLEASQRSPAWLFNSLPSVLDSLVDQLPLPANERFRRARARLDATIYRLIAERRRSSDDQGDLLSMFLHGTDDQPAGERMTDKQLRDEVITIFLAGHETTASAMTWFWYLLSQHPEVEAKVHAEIDAVLDGSLPTLDHLAHLHYTDMVLHEAMRLYPPVWLIGRQALNSFSVGGYHIPAGSLLILSPYVVHRDPRYFPDPTCFDPIRWTPEARAERPKFSFFPFGGGPRQCIGEAFAWMETALVVATVAQQWKLRLMPDHPVALLPLVTLRPRYGMHMKLEARTSQSNAKQ